jgi:hypothetical protein
MSAVWKSSGQGWTLLQPSGFPTEQELHDLVGEAPELLPLAGSPAMTIVGSEVALGSNFADLIGVEPTGRLAIIEVKLARNSEARRAVVSQALSYAAFLQGLTIAEVEDGVLARHLSQRRFTSLSAAARGADETAFDDGEFRLALAKSLEQGAFRIVFVLDEAPSATEHGRCRSCRKHVQRSRLGNAWSMLGAAGQLSFPAPGSLAGACYSVA